jgi:hypothetical protein
MRAFPVNQRQALRSPLTTPVTTKLPSHIILKKSSVSSKIVSSKINYPPKFLATLGERGRPDRRRRRPADGVQVRGIKPYFCPFHCANREAPAHQPQEDTDAKHHQQSKKYKEQI